MWIHMLTDDILLAAQQPATHCSCCNSPGCSCSRSLHLSASAFVLRSGVGVSPHGVELEQRALLPALPIHTPALFAAIRSVPSPMIISGLRCRGPQPLSPS